MRPGLAWAFFMALGRAERVANACYTFRDMTLPYPLIVRVQTGSHESQHPYPSGHCPGFCLAIFDLFSGPGGVRIVFDAPAWLCKDRSSNGKKLLTRPQTFDENF